MIFVKILLAIVGLFIVISVAAVIAACINSSIISQKEYERELERMARQSEGKPQD